MHFQVYYDMVIAFLVEISFDGVWMRTGQKGGPDKVRDNRV
jgi:hypothetical protein